MNSFMCLQHILRCPSCHSMTLNKDSASSELNCESCVAQYPLTHGRSVLLRPDNDVFCLEDYRRAALPSPDILVGGIARFISAPIIARYVGAKHLSHT